MISVIQVITLLTVFTLNSHAKEIKDGPYEIKKGNCVAVGTYINGKKNGVETLTCPKKKEIKTYKNGELNGPAEFYENGILTEKGTHRDGMKAGIWKVNLEGELLNNDYGNARKAMNKAWVINNVNDQCHTQDGDSQSLAGTAQQFFGYKPHTERDDWILVAKNPIKPEFRAFADSKEGCEAARDAARRIASKHE